MYTLPMQLSRHVCNVRDRFRGLEQGIHNLNKNLKCLLGFWSLNLFYIVVYFFFIVLCLIQIHTRNCTRYLSVVCGEYKLYSKLRFIFIFIHLFSIIELRNYIHFFLFANGIQNKYKNKRNRTVCSYNKIVCLLLDLRLFRFTIWQFKCKYKKLKTIIRKLTK